MGVPVVGVWLALLVALVAFAGGAEAATTTRSAPFTVDTNLKLASGFTADELNAFVKKYEASSPLAKYGTYFVQAEQKSNVNAQGLLAIAINQTAWGTAGAAKDNNFFAIKGKKYSSASAGILDGAAWIDKNYLTKGGPYYVSPTLKGMATHYASNSSWATQVAAIADRMRGAAAARTPTAAPKAPTPCPPSSRTCKPAPAPSQAPQQPQPSCVPAMKPQSGQGASMALPCNPTPNGNSDNAGGNGNGPNDAAAQGGVALPPEGSDAASDSGGAASPAPAAGQNPGDQGGSNGSNGSNGSGGSQAAPAPSQSPASPGITMAGSVQRVAQSGGALVPLLFGLVLLIGGLVAVVIARRRPTF